MRRGLVRHGVFQESSNFGQPPTSLAYTAHAPAAPLAAWLGVGVGVGGLQADRVKWLQIAVRYDINK